MVKNKTLWQRPGFLLDFSLREEETAFEFVVSQIGKVQEYQRARLILPSDLKRVWPQLLQGGYVVLDGGGVPMSYARRYVAYTTLFQAVSRRKGERVRLFFYVGRTPLNSRGSVARAHLLSLSGLYAWICLEEEERMWGILRKRTHRQLKALGVEGEALLLARMGGGAILLLSHNQKEIDGFGLAFALEGQGYPPIPLEFWQAKWMAGERARTLEPPSLQSFISLLRSQGLVPKGVGPKRLAKQAWKPVAQALLMRELTR